MRYSFSLRLYHCHNLSHLFRWTLLFSTFILIRRRWARSSSVFFTLIIELAWTEKKTREVQVNPVSKHLKISLEWEKYQKAQKHTEIDYFEIKKRANFFFFQLIDARVSVVALWWRFFFSFEKKKKAFDRTPRNDLNDENESEMSRKERLQFKDDARNWVGLMASL